MRLCEQKSEALQCDKASVHTVLKRCQEKDWLGCFVAVGCLTWLRTPSVSFIRLCEQKSEALQCDKALVHRVLKRIEEWLGWAA